MVTLTSSGLLGKHQAPEPATTSRAAFAAAHSCGTIMRPYCHFYDARADLAARTVISNGSIKLDELVDGLMGTGAVVISNLRFGILHSGNQLFLVSNESPVALHDVDPRLTSIDLNSKLVLQNRAKEASYICLIPPDGYRQLGSIIYSSQGPDSAEEQPSISTPVAGKMVLSSFRGKLGSCTVTSSTIPGLDITRVASYALSVALSGDHGLSYYFLSGGSNSSYRLYVGHYNVDGIPAANQYAVLHNGDGRCLLVRD
jgi:hypothetical protein